MTHTDLAQKFDEVQKTHLDFIEWAATYGVKISSGVCLRHLGRYPNEKPRKISEGFRLAYLLYFSSLDCRTLEKYEVETETHIARKAQMLSVSDIFVFIIFGCGERLHCCCLRLRRL